jgi:transcriptional regulator with XRE-family HTH domain
MENIVEKIVAKKAELHVTNAWIAEHSKVPEHTVTRIMNGTSKSPSFATIIPIAEALGVSLTPQTIEQAEAKVTEQITEEVTEQIVAEVQKPTPSQTIAEELERQYSLLLEEKDKRIQDKDSQIRILWRVVSVLAAALAACVVGYVII